MLFQGMTSGSCFCWFQKLYIVYARIHFQLWNRNWHRYFQQYCRINATQRLLWKEVPRKHSKCRGRKTIILRGDFRKNIFSLCKHLLLKKCIKFQSFWILFPNNIDLQKQGERQKCSFGVIQLERERHFSTSLHLAFQQSRLWWSSSAAKANSEPMWKQEEIKCWC